MVKIKICGMRESENIKQVSTLRPDYIGFIFYESSPRYVGDDFRMPFVDKIIKKVGVFVNAPVDTMKEAHREHRLDYLQLHGSEPIEVCEQLKSAGISLIKVFSVDDNFDFAATKPYTRCVDFFLFDTKGKYYGGNAKAFNWTILQKYDQAKPFFLSGGLSPDNIGLVEKIKELNIHALDINSGVELTPGLKDITKVQKIQNIITSVL